MPPKNCITVFLGHGTGDKKYGGTKQYSSTALLSKYDYNFITGPKHLQKLRDIGLEMPEEKLIKIGNLRFDRYVNREIDFDREYNRLGIVDRERKNILYAPTWEYGNGTFNTYFKRFAKILTRQYNLIVRPHYHDRNKIVKSRLWARLNRIEHLYFSDPAELVNDSMINDFVISDIMISDTSSILYEYLITGKPIIIAANDYNDLHQMPDQMNVVNYATIFDGSGDIEEIVAQELVEQKYRQDYKRLLESCFYFNDGKSIQRVRDFVQSQSRPG